MLLLMEQLYKAGYRRPGSWLGGFHNWQSGYTFNAAFEWCRKEWFPEANITPHKKRTKDWRRDVIEWIEKTKPDVVVGCHGELDKVLLEKGIRVPEDIGLVHLDLTEDVAGWSGIECRHSTIGALAVESLAIDIISRWKRSSIETTIHLVEGKWTQGRTTRPVPSTAMAPRYPENN